MQKRSGLVKSGIDLLSTSFCLSYFFIFSLFYGPTEKDGEQEVETRFTPTRRTDRKLHLELD